MMEQKTHEMQIQDMTCIFWVGINSILDSPRVHVVRLLSLWVCVRYECLHGCVSACVDVCVLALFS